MNWITYIYISICSVFQPLRFIQFRLNFGLCGVPSVALLPLYLYSVTRSSFSVLSLLGLGLLTFSVYNFLLFFFFIFIRSFVRSSNQSRWIYDDVKNGWRERETLEWRGYFKWVSRNLDLRAREFHPTHTFSLCVPIYLFMCIKRVCLLLLFNFIWCSLCVIETLAFVDYKNCRKIYSRWERARDQTTLNSVNRTLKFRSNRWLTWELQRQCPGPL